MFSFVSFSAVPVPSSIPPEITARWRHSPASRPKSVRHAHLARAKGRLHRLHRLQGAPPTPQLLLEGSAQPLAWLSALGALPAWNWFNPLVTIARTDSRRMENTLEHINMNINWAAKATGGSQPKPTRPRPRPQSPSTHANVIFVSVSTHAAVQGLWQKKRQTQARVTFKWSLSAEVIALAISPNSSEDHIHPIPPGTEFRPGNHRARSGPRAGFEVFGGGFRNCF